MAVKRLQNGSAHVIIIIVLVVALIGALGWIFWQNMSRNKDADLHKSDKHATSNKVEEREAKLVSGHSELAQSLSPLTFKYPETWKLNREIKGPNPPNGSDISSEAITITAPDDSMSVGFDISNGGIGGMCVPEEEGKIRSLSYEGLQNTKGVSFATYVTDDLDGTKHSYAGLIRTVVGGSNNVASLKAGDSSCSVYLRNALSVSGSSLSLNVMSPSIRINGQDTSPDISSRYSGRMYEEAKAILLSTKMTLSNP